MADFNAFIDIVLLVGIPMLVIYKIVITFTGSNTENKLPQIQNNESNQKSHNMFDTMTNPKYMNTPGNTHYDSRNPK